MRPLAQVGDRDRDVDGHRHGRIGDGHRAGIGAADELPRHARDVGLAEVAIGGAAGDHQITARVDDRRGGVDVERRSGVVDDQLDGRDRAPGGALQGLDDQVVPAAGRDRRHVRLAERDGEGAVRVDGLRGGAGRQAVDGEADAIGGHLAGRSPALERTARDGEHVGRRVRCRQVGDVAGRRRVQAVDGRRRRGRRRAGPAARACRRRSGRRACRRRPRRARGPRRTPGT